MLSIKNCGRNSSVSPCFTRQLVLILVACTGLYAVSYAQTCPPNIDFETGTFDGWTCYTGSAGVLNDQNVISLSFSGPVPNRHTMYTRTATPELDPYGGFPVVCPNGSGHSIRLGNNIAGTEAEGISYQFTIPADRNVYSLIYHYAVVFQDPNHLEYQQPRMEIEITNVTDNTIISCSSFTFIPYGSPLPGFFVSSNPGSDTPVWCKDWSAVSINLDGHAGKTIRLFFKTADCTFRRHFGYAYIDLNSECSGEFTGAKFCPGDTAVQLVAPFGYQGYTWSNTSFTQVLGNDQTLTLRPAPTAGTTLAVQVGPYYGYGCPDTLYARLSDTFRIKAHAGADGRVCNNEPIQIGTSTTPGVFYQWSPAIGLTDPTISNPFANPRAPTNYVVTSRSYGGGCLDRDTVTVTPVLLDSAIQLIGRASFCFGSSDSAVLHLTGAAESVQWYRNNTPIVGGNTGFYKVTQSGSYYAVQQKQGCTTTTAQQAISIEKARPGTIYPVVYVLANTPVTLQARQFGDTIHWRPASYLNTVTSYKPVFSGPVEQSYGIEIKTAANCITIDSQTVKIVSRADIFVPTAFTPNNDGRNDILRPILFGIKELRYFRVYNRWGELIFESRDPNRGWDGSVRGKLLANETVVWVAEGIGLDGRSYLRKGTSICIQ
ncbi:MAG: gliding motility-associated C-terminal domain-containing protein [Williamsia sp.]|nr:gliding motility-associated C-terminal domain-containing protein [Williamsia sp.]